MRLKKTAHIAIFLLCGIPLAYAQAPQFDSTGEQQMVELINQERAQHGLEALTVDPRLTQAARQHTELMVQNRALSHQFDNESDLPMRFAGQNLRSDKQAENVASGVDVASANTSLLQSPPHRANILSPEYNAIGVGIVRSGNQVYVTEDFAHRTTDYSEPAADAALQKSIEQYATSHGMPAPQRKPATNLRQIACDMALNDALDPSAVGHLPGVTSAAVWNSGELTNLPNNVKGLLAQPLNAGYSLGVCFAPSVSHPGGVYWSVLVAY